MTPEDRTDEWLRQMKRTFPISPPRVRHRRKEAAALAGIIVAVVVLVTYGVLAIVYQLS